MTAVELAMEMVHANTKDERSVYDYLNGKITFEELRAIRDECWQRLDKARKQLANFVESKEE